MTLEHRLVIELGEIASVRVACPHCGTVINSPIRNWKPQQIDCPNCSKTLWKAGEMDVRNMALLAQAFRNLLDGEGSGGVKVRLEVKRPPEADANVPPVPGT